MSDSKKSKDKFFTDTYAVLDAIRYGVTTNSDVMTLLGISKQDAYYWIQKLCEEGFLKKVARGNYKVTEEGKRFYDEYERLKNKQLIRIENLSISYTIIVRLDDVIKKIDWEKSYPLNNEVRVYQTHIKGHFVKLVVGKNKTPAIEISCKKHYDINPNEAYFFARLEIEQIADFIEDKTGVRLPKGVITKKPEFATPSPLAEALLITHGASQIRTNKGIINRSKGRNADIEPMSLQQAQRVVDLPDTVEKIKETILNLSTDSEKICMQLDYLFQTRQNPYDFSQYN